LVLLWFFWVELKTRSKIISNLMPSWNSNLNLFSFQTKFQANMLISHMPILTGTIFKQHFYVCYFTLLSLEELWNNKWPETFVIGISSWHSSCLLCQENIFKNNTTGSIKVTFLFIIANVLNKWLIWISLNRLNYNKI
jgi:hypothetical protein